MEKTTPLPECVGRTVRFEGHPSGRTFTGKWGYSARTDDYYIEGTILEDVNDYPLVCSGEEGHMFTVWDTTSLIKRVDSVVRVPSRIT